MKKVFFILLACLVFAGQATAKDLTTPEGYKLDTAPVQSVYAYNASGDLEYMGKAVPGTATTEPKWQIQKLVYTDGNLTGIYFADGDMGFSKTWDQRESYSYD